MADGGISQNEENMANNGFLTAKVVWKDDELTKEYKTAQKQIINGISEVLNGVGGEMKNMLQEYINTDVYQAYTPKAYLRRKDYPQYGTPLDSDKNFHISTKKTKDDATLTFLYNPKGYHRAKYKDLPNDYRDFTSNKPIKPNPVHGDELIQRIQTGEGYDWNAPDVKPRQFWDHFTRGEFDGGIEMQFNYFALKTNFTDYEYEYEPVEANDIYRYGQDGVLDTPAKDYDDDDLPF